MSISEKYEYAILNLRVRFLEAFRRTTPLTDIDLWDVVEYVPKDCQLGEMLAREAQDGE